VLRLLTPLTLLLASAACSQFRDAQGYLGDPTLMSEVRPGTDNRESVARTLGRPSLEAQWGAPVWYYITRETRQLAFRDPRLIRQEILAIHFDARGTVTKVERRGAEQVAAVRPSRDKTPTLGKERTIWQDIFGNIGQVGSVGQTSADPDNTGGP
jgi:outer membrane protein assembly factor BamE (lipoprotein component of BamABCDE complex)